MPIEPGIIVKTLIPSEPVTVNQIQPLGSMVSMKYIGVNSNNQPRITSEIRLFLVSVSDLTAFLRLVVRTTASLCQFGNGFDGGSHFAFCVEIADTKPYCTKRISTQCLMSPGGAMQAGTACNIIL